MKRKKLDKTGKCIYNCIYKGDVRWSRLKDIHLKLTRQITFKEIIKANLLGIRDNPSRDHQRVLIYEYKNHIWAVPFVFDEQGIFLKTIYPSRKYKKLYQKG